MVESQGCDALRRDGFPKQKPQRLLDFKNGRNLLAEPDLTANLSGGVPFARLSRLPRDG
jgi:hypothetical protein